MRMFIATAVAAAFILGGCGAQMELNHFNQTQDKVAVPAIVAFSKTYPNDVIKEIYEQKMYDGSTSYKFISADSKGVAHTTTISADGKRVDKINLL